MSPSEALLFHYRVPARQWPDAPEWATDSRVKERYEQRLIKNINSVRRMAKLDEILVI
jgi:hypothetical protein